MCFYIIHTVYSRQRWCDKSFLQQFQFSCILCGKYKQKQHQVNLFCVIIYPLMCVRCWVDFIRLVRLFSFLQDTVYSPSLSIIIPCIPLLCACVPPSSFSFQTIYFIRCIRLFIHRQGRNRTTFARSLFTKAVCMKSFSHGEEQY